MRNRQTRLRVALNGFSKTEADLISSNEIEISGLLYIRNGSRSCSGSNWPYDEFKKSQWVGENQVDAVPDEILSTVTSIKQKFFDCFHRWYWSHELISDFTDAEMLFTQALSNSYNWLKVTKPDLLVFSNVPHEGALTVLYETAKAMKIPTMVCWQGIVPGHFWMFDHWSDLGIFESSPAGVGAEIDATRTDKKPFYMSMVEPSNRSVRKNIIKSIIYGFKALYYSLFLREKYLKAFRRNISKFSLATENKAYFRNRDRVFGGQLEDIQGKKVVYLPLHLEPEMEIDQLGGDYSNQVRAIQMLRNKIPEDVTIAVKDNPYQDSRKRGASFFNLLSGIDNVILMNSSVPSSKLIEHSTATATVCGTAGWEALKMGKPAIVFGYAFWKKLPGVFEITGDWKFSDLEKFVQDRIEFEKSVDKLSKYSWPGIVDYFYIRSIGEFNPNKNAINISRAIVAFANHNHIKCLSKEKVG